MDDAQLLHLATLFLAACKAQQDAGVLERSVRYSDFAMAKALQREHQRGNALLTAMPDDAGAAKRVTSFFKQTMQLVSDAGLFYWTNADKTHFIVEISSRQMNDYVLDKDFSNALVLVTEYRYQLQRTTRID